MMCISFFYINEKCEADAFRFILIFNRDEFHSRETKNAHFWEDYPDILAGNVHNAMVHTLDRYQHFNATVPYYVQIRVHIGRY